MCTRVSLRSSLRIVLGLFIGLALLQVPCVSLIISAMAQRQDHRPRTPPPRPGKPEGTFPNLGDVQNESQLERESPPPIPSTIRSQKNSGKPWDGRRVGDPEPARGLDQAKLRRFDRSSKSLRSHAVKRMTSPPTIYEDQFIQNFFSVALGRSATYEETLYWNYMLRAAYGHSQLSLKFSTIEFGKTLFESAAYAARNRDPHWYVYDLYKTYLMREPDSVGWSNWEATVSTHGREYVRRGFEESTEFAMLIATIVPGGPANPNASSLVSARVDRRNQPGNGMLTRDAVWSVPLLSLPGRNGLDLGLTLSYSSMVWTRSGPYIYFDEDNGFPSPGFRLGFPTVQQKSFDAETLKNVYMMITAGGQRVELRQVGTSNIYDAADSSYLRLTEIGGTLLVQSTDGTKLSFSHINGEYRCVEIKDRNGNYITINNNALGRMSSITDTLGRVINFNYDTNANLISITQAWNGQPSHQWVSFGWSTRNLRSSFSGAAVVGTSNGTVLPVITQVALNNTSYFTFDYTNSLQVSLVKKYFGAVERNATNFNYETPGSDVPRLVSSSVSAQNWTGVNGVPSQVTTQYGVDADGACVLTAPDGTIYKEYYGTGWQRGLTTRSEVRSGGELQKWTTTAWTQDNTSVGYELNPRVTEINIYDSSGNRRRTTIDYGSYVHYGLPYIVREYAAGGGTEIRQTVTDYNLSQAYLDQRIIGLVSEVQLKNGTGQALSKITYSYDDPGRLHGVPAAATQHDLNYNLSFMARGNVSAISRWDVDDINNAAKKLTSYTDYYNTGTPISATDPGGHTSSVTYTDSFSDNVNRNTFAYPTTLTDADGFSSQVQYNFDFGATTRTQSPAPAGQTQGAIQTLSYNNLGQLERVTTTNNGAYKRFWYGADYTASYATVNNVADEAYSIAVVDGVGRVIGAVSNHPGSTGGYSLVNTIYNQMGRAWKVSNPTEVNSSWAPSGDDSAGIYYTTQTYDWRGRPLVTSNPDGTTREASYAGCGCAGGEVVTLTDEGTIDNGVAKRRKQKIYSDVLARPVKAEIYNWQDSNDVYSATVNTYNTRDQITQVRQYAGPEGGSTYQDTTLSYDGYGRLKTRHVPEQHANANTVWDYNADDTVQKITDGRGAATHYAYDKRHLLTNITFTVPSNSQIPVPGAISFGYDAASNRTSMTDGTGSTAYGYDSLSRMNSESRTFTGLTGTYTLNYSYNLADALTDLSIPFRSQQIGYTYDTANRLSAVSASGFSTTYDAYPNQYTQTVTSFASNIAYRAWGGRKSMTYGNTTSEQITYNSRLQPATYTLNSMNYQNTNICCSYPIYSTMTWSYAYYSDGALEHAWDSTNEWFDRAYKYDHVGRLKEASTYRRARGLSPYPSVSHADPYFQTITYDVWNHSSRIGLLYTGALSDTGTYVNNRRADHSYDADGNTTSTGNYTQTIDAAGMVNHSVSVATVGDGTQYPLEPRLDISQTYDGNGTPAKRDQITRLPVFDGFGNQSAPVEDTKTAYYVKSSVLGGAVVVELAGTGWTDMVYIYAAGERIASEGWGGVGFEHQNPVTGSSVLSHGHSSYRTTSREERDPRGAEVPLENPYGYAESYVEWKFSEPLFIEGGDPFDYSSGRTIDGLPVSEAEFQRRTRSGSAGAGVFIGGKFGRFIDLSGLAGFSYITVAFDIYRSGQKTSTPDFWYYLGSFIEDFALPPVLANPNQGSTKPRPQVINRVPLGNLRENLEKLLKDGCAAYVQNLLDELNRSFSGGYPHIKTFWEGYNRIMGEKGGGYQVNEVSSNGGTVTGDLFAKGGAKGTVHLTPHRTIGRQPTARETAEAQARYAYGAVHETFHLAKQGGYTDFEIASAAYRLDNMKVPEGIPSDQVLTWSDRFDNFLKQHCRNDTTPIQKKR